MRKYNKVSSPLLRLLVKILSLGTYNPATDIGRDAIDRLNEAKKELNKRKKKGE